MYIARFKVVLTILEMFSFISTDGSDKDGSNSGGSDEEFDDSKNDFRTDGCSDCSSY